MLEPNKYKGFWNLLDTASFILSYPFVLCVNVFLSCFIPTTRTSVTLQIFTVGIVSPLCFVLGILFLPFGVVGFLLWIVLNTFIETVPYRYWEYPVTLHEVDVDDIKNVFTIATANLCLLPDFLARFNNNALTYRRSIRIAQKIMDVQTGVDGSGIFDNYVMVNFPNMAFICFQEVWGREFAWILMQVMKKRFRYFLFDVGVNQWNINHYFLGSGLMFASKYPILDVDFHCFHVKTFQGTFTSIGLLQIKVSLGKKLRNEVGYIATTHLQSYQGKKECLLPQLDECMQWLENFRNKTKNIDEVVTFDLVCGDFNFDNLSPGDQKYSKHEIFEEYYDPCRIAPGFDHDWTIGTEFRQRMLWEDEINTPEKLKLVLMDPVMRRYFILDANVLEQNMQLAFLKPPYDQNGKVTSCRYGGRRRIDYILCNKSYPVHVTQFNFITALTQLTDHIPVVMTFTKKNY